jgi:hypothetical protein
MKMDFSKFDKEYDLQGLKEDIKEVEENGGSGNFKDVPIGEYEVTLTKLELGVTGLKAKTPGSPMVKAQFKILEGEYENQMIFLNQVVSQAFQIHIVNTLLKSFDTGLFIEFESYSQYNDLLMDVAEAMDGMEFALDYGENSKGFKTYEVIEIFEAA